MKHLLSTALLCGAAIFGSQAQNIVVVDKDNLSHRYNAEYVQDITFLKDGGSEATEITLESLSLQTWSKTNITLHFAAGENTKLDLDIYQPSTLWLLPGEYKVDPSYADFTVDPDYSEVTLEGEAYEITGGELIISSTDDVYTFNINLTLSGDKQLNATYTGKLDTYGPSIAYNLSNCTYNEINEPAANGFYYKLNDADYKLELRLNIFNSGDELANGMYVFDTTGDDGTAACSVDLYSPYNELTKYTEGIVNISGEGANRVIEINGKLENGLKCQLTYTGEIPARPAGEVKADYEFVASACMANAYNENNIGMTFSSTADPSMSMAYDLYQAANYYLTPGTYTVDGSGMPGTIDPSYPGYCYFAVDGTSYKFKSGSAVFTNEGNYYTMDANFVLENDKTVHATFAGELSCGPNVEFTLNQVKYVTVNDPAANAFYYRFSDADSNIEARIDFFAEGNTLPDGTYTFDTTGVNGTAQSLVDLYKPVNLSSASFKSGNVTVATDGTDRIITINGVLNNKDIPVKATFKGALPERPSADTPATYTFNATEGSAKDWGFGSWYATFTAPNTKEAMTLCFAPVEGTTITPGTYVIGGDENPYYCGLGTIYTNASGDTYEMVSGTVVVALENNVYTITVNATLENDETLKATYTGELFSNSETPKEPDFVFTANSCNVQPYGSRNYSMVFSSTENPDMTLAFDLYHEDNWYLQPGTYTVAGAQNGEINKNDATYTYFTANGTKYTFESGEVIFTYEETEGDYTMDAQIVLNDGKVLSASYIGKLSCGPNTQVYNLNSVAYVEVNEPAANAFYYRFTDTSNYGIEARIDFFAEGNTLPDGTYTFDNTGANGTANSVIDLYKPVSLTSVSFKSGNVTVATEGTNRVITIEGVLGDDNIPVKAVFTGALPARPSADEPVNYDITFEAVRATYTFNSATKCTVQLYTTDNATPVVRLGLMHPSNTERVLEAETYYINDDSKPYYTAATSTKYTDESDNVTTFNSGTVVVTKADNGTYTVVVDGVLSDNKTIKATWTGTF